MVVIVSTHQDGMPPITASWFCSWLQDAANDFRVGRGALCGVKVAVYGCGNSLYGANYNAVGYIWKGCCQVEALLALLYDQGNSVGASSLSPHHQAVLFIGRVAAFLHTSLLARLCYR